MSWNYVGEEWDVSKKNVGGIRARGVYNCYSKCINQSKTESQTETAEMVCFSIGLLLVIGWFYFAFYPCVMPKVIESMRVAFASDFLEMFSWLASFVQWWTLEKFLYITMPFSVMLFIMAICTEKYDRIATGILGFVTPVILLAGIPVLIMMAFFIVVALIATVGTLYSLGGVCLVFFSLIDQRIFYGVLAIFGIGLVIAYFAIPMFC